LVGLLSTYQQPPHSSQELLFFPMPNCWEQKVCLPNHPFIRGDYCGGLLGSVVQEPVMFTTRLMIGTKLCCQWKANRPRDRLVNLRTSHALSRAGLLLSLPVLIASRDTRCTGWMGQGLELAANCLNYPWPCKLHIARFVVNAVS